MLILLGHLVSVFSVIPPGGLGWSVAYRPAVGLLRVASNIRVRLVAERTPLGKNLLAAMQNAGFPIRRQLNLLAARMSRESCCCLSKGKQGPERVEATHQEGFIC